MTRTREIIKSEREELIRQSDTLKAEYDAIDGNESLANLEKKFILEAAWLRLECEILRLGIEYACTLECDEETTPEDSEEAEVTQNEMAQRLENSKTISPKAIALFKDLFYNLSLLGLKYPNLRRYLKWHLY